MADRAKTPSPEKSPVFRAIGAFLAALGLLPSLLLFVWVERNMALPWIGTWIGWPWIFVEGGPAWSLAWNAFTILVFGFAHSGLAGGRVPRGVYVFVTGLVSLFMLATWQPTGVILYQAIPSALGASIVSFAIYWTLLAFAFRAITRFESAWTFVGLRAPSAAGSRDGPDGGSGDARAAEKLATDGGYGLVRHPAYLLTLAAWFVTPMLSLDRLVFALGMTIYLAIGIRFEERRLVEAFGEAYLVYQRRVPSLFPRFKK